MSTANASEVPPANPKWMTWSGWVLSVLPMPLMIGGAVYGLMKPEAGAEQFTKMGWPLEVAKPLAITELVCATLYIIPQTAVLGAILLTGYMGGAIATHVRIHEPFYIQIGFGVILWLGLYLRDPRLRALLPLRR